MVKDLDQRSTTTDQGPTTQEMTYDLRSVLGFCLFVSLLTFWQKKLLSGVSSTLSCPM